MALVSARSPLIEALDPTPEAPVMGVLEEPAAKTRGLRTAIKPTHPDCVDCCARKLCHWCLRPARKPDGYVMYRWSEDGLWYGACEDHERELRAAIQGLTSPNAMMVDICQTALGPRGETAW